MNVILRYIRQLPGRRALLLALVATAAGCSAARPLPPTEVPPPPASPVAALTPSPGSPSPQPPAARRLGPGNLMAPADLTLAGAYPASGWRRCDDYSVHRNLERYRAQFEIGSSIAAVWEYGASCGGANAAMRVDEYAWLARNEGAAAALIQQLDADAYLGNVAPELRSKLREFARAGLGVRVLTRQRGDQASQRVAEIIGQRGAATVYVRVISVRALTDEEYMDLGRQLLERVAGQEGRQA